ncbi:uridylate kinase [Marinitoga hydrogenitolerans DSM 16785]|uniref:Uridylate kinase n=1 Tax=Marinitoga hydrogenitolerans (strain DSM 16785 / JCM 12826 / AT1271) TaxID=1122195 RepID=A0A1M4YR21_MARH1|nr:UMP kinase [Marinitoga hydrogenitolerans]SHF08299.1 uridylate kinase [Marinitoga hydrogenitolerans DSM 16785]
MYNRILLKLSGEVLSGEDKKGFDEKAIDYLSNEIKDIVKHGIKLGMVIGAGNLFRGRELEDVTNTIGDHIGMLGTVINALYLKDYFERKGIKTVVVSQIVDLPSVRRIHYDDIELYFNAGYVVIFAGGTSNPFFTTDTAAALRAVEMKADILIKATKVDGIYDKDPKKFENAKKYDKITYDDAINLGLKIMDTEAFSICKRYKMPIIVLNFFKKNNLLNALLNSNIGTFVKP